MDNIKEKILINLTTLKNLTLRNIKTKYASTTLGIFLAILNPLLLMLVISFVFLKVLAVDFENFHIYVLTGILPWLFFSSVIFEAAHSLFANASLLRQFKFPAIFLPISIVISGFIQHLVGLAFILPVFLFYNFRVIFFLPLIIIPLISFLLFVIGIGILVAIVNVYFRDLEHLLGVLLMFWFWMTPIFYSPFMVPAKYRFFLWINPISYFIIGYRNILFYARSPSYLVLIFMLLWGLIAFLTGWRLFASLKDDLVKKI